MKIGIISGSGFYEYPELENIDKIKIKTRFGTADLFKGTLKTKEIYYINRHGDNHGILSHQVNYRANMCALKDVGVDCIIGTSVMGVLQKEIPLGIIFVFNDLFFLDNRLPNGETCTVFNEIDEKDKGHLIFSTPFSNTLQNVILNSIKALNYEYYDKAVYAHVNGPRFNGKTEIKVLSSLGLTALSQTAGPEIVLAGELEIPYQLIGFGVDYANGVMEEPTSAQELNENICKSNAMLRNLITDAVEKLEGVAFDNGFVYRF
ncbi:MAG: MTAP family purine nucleoside phosphorylase [Desulfamplus sp.]|nr:MTAP family purine nucleoside phosphorylase [Desulfamplus sp.]